ncbi:hypothetical protein [Nocardiopsis sp. LOL_012]|uniref:hypothetical protein n=1 Tax=Nocardiopsis sp. LOL_012 TaxID=3345409 RepID=UPI003A8A97EA
MHKTLSSPTTPAQRPEDAEAPSSSSPPEPSPAPRPSPVAKAVQSVDWARAAESLKKGSARTGGLLKVLGARTGAFLAAVGARIALHLKESAVRVGRLLRGHRPGEHPPQDVRHAFALMLAAVPAFGFLAYTGYTQLDPGVPGTVRTEMWTLTVTAGLAGLALGALAVPVRRAVPLLHRAAQVCALAGMGVALMGLHRAAQLADTAILVASAVAALFAVVANVALWSTSVRTWCRAAPQG